MHSPIPVPGPAVASRLPDSLPHHHEIEPAANARAPHEPVIARLKNRCTTAAMCAGVAFLISVSSVFAPNAVAAPAPATQTATRADRILVRPRSTSAPADVQQLYTTLGCRVAQTFPLLGGVTILALNPGVSPSGVIAALQATGLFEYAEPDYVATGLLHPNDPYYTSGQQWPLNNTGASGGVAGADIMADLAWDVVHDAPTILVALVDSGIRYTHEDLVGNLWTNPGETGLDNQGRDKRTNGVDDDGDGYVDDVYGINVLNHTGDPNDDWGHGTHVAGILGAVANNGAGIAGVAWRVKIMACKFISGSGQYSVSDAVTALDFARAKGARIVTGAWGGYSFTSSALRDAVMALRDANILLVAAAGNDGANNDATPLFPASFEYSNVISVAATDNTDNRASFSNYGALTVDLGAPGAAVLSCWSGSNSDYRTASGTSMASAHVAGACALLWARFPSASHQQIIQRLLGTVDPLPSLAGKTVSGGRLNLAAALSSAAPTITSPPTASGTANTFFSYQITATNSPNAYAATNLGGTGLSLNSTTGLISGTPTGSSPITSQLSASNWLGTSAPLTLTITITPAISIPTITSPATAAATAGKPFSYQITASGSPTGFGATNLAGTGLAFNANTGVISGTPLTATPIVTQLTASNTAGTSAPLTLTITVNSAAVPPVITSSATASATVGTSFSYQITATGSPTSFAATNLFGTGLALNATTGLISGAPLNVGPIISQLTAVSAVGTSTPVTLTINVQTAPPPVPAVTSATVSGQVGSSLSYAVTATNAPTQFSLRNQPPGLAIAPATGVISGIPTSSGTYAAIVSATNVSGTGEGTITFAISSAYIPPPPPPPPPPPVLQSQTVTFAAPVGALVVGQSVRLGATASSGLPVAYRLISGSASLAGDTVTFADAAPVMIRATQSGSTVYAAASADVTLTAQKAAQRLNADPSPSAVRADQTVSLTASATSGLPVNYTVVRGPAFLAANTLSFKGSAGTVVVRVSQPGNDTYAAADPVDLTFRVNAIGPQVYLGKLGTDDFAAVLDADNAHGVLLSRLAATDETLAVNFSVSNDGSFTAIADAAVNAPTSSATAAAPSTRSLSGTVVDGVLTGRVAELGSAFSASVQPPSGPTAATAGLYVAAIPGSAVGQTYVVTGPNRQAYALLAAPAGASAGNGTVSESGLVSVPLASGAALAATIDAATATLSGAITQGTTTLPIAGLNSATTSTDRLVNLSSRLRVAGADAAHDAIAGFVVSGNTTRQILIRAVGPGLAAFSVKDPLVAPELQVFDAAGRVIASNRGWNNDTAIAAAAERAGAFKLAAGSADAALLLPLAPGGYTARVVSASSGVALIEIYDVPAQNAPATRPLLNLSTRGFVGTSDDVLVGGFVVSGNVPKRLLIRAIGPGLAPFGVTAPLSDPVLKIYGPDGALVAQNDQWSSLQPVNPSQIVANGDDLAAAARATGAFALPPGSLDAALVVALTPGAYTAIVSGAGTNTGAALVEVYELPSP